jgi:hypothetical protein
MPLLDPSLQARSLDLYYDDPAKIHYLLLMSGDPGTLDDPAADWATLELASDGGYARVIVSDTDWDPADVANGTKAISTEWFFPDATAAYSDTATHFGLADGDDPTLLADYGELESPITVTGAGTGPSLLVTVYYDNSLAI